MTNERETGKNTLSTFVNRVGVPAYLFPPGVEIVGEFGVGKDYSLVATTSFEERGLRFYEKYMKAHQQLSFSYLDSNFKDFSTLNKKQKEELSLNYSVFFLKTIVNLYDTQHNFSTRDSLVKGFTFEKFLNWRLSFSLSEGHPFYRREKMSDVVLDYDKEGEPSVILPSGKDHDRNVRQNARIRSLVLSRLDNLEVGDLVKLYFDESKKKEFIAGLPLLV